MPRSYSDLFSDFPDFQRSKRCDLKTSYNTFWGIVACTFILFFPQNFTKQLETAHHQLKKVITHIETKYQCLLTSVITFRLTYHVTEFGGPSSEI